MRILALLTLFVAASATADVILTFEEVGGDVVATWSGTYDVSDAAPSLLGAGIGKFLAGTTFGPSGVFQGGAGTTADFYEAVMPVGMFTATSVSFSATSSGDEFGFNSAIGTPGVMIPEGTTSGSVSGTSTFTGTDFATLGLVEGSYSMTWGGGDDAGETATITVGAVPEPSSLLLCGAMLAVCGWRRRQP